MTFESLKENVNVLEIVSQRVPGCRTGSMFLFKTELITIYFLFKQTRQKSDPRD